LAPCEKRVTWRGGVTTSVRGDAISKRGKGGDNVSWADMNLTRPKMKKMHAVDSAAINER
jgi:hypothetical protein